MARKTFSVDTLKTMVNGISKHTPDADIDGRETVQMLLENVLMETGNYKGFCYLDTNNMIDSANGTTVGINESDDYDARFKDTDRTRVKYF